MSESFWDFSIRTYRADGVPDACLFLQDEREVDVNMLLFCTWFGATRGLHEAGSFANVFDFSENWAVRVVRPLRQVRTWMKVDGCQDSRVPTDSCMNFRAKVKATELTAEKMQQDVLESLVDSIPEKDLSFKEQLEGIVKNIQQYFSAVKIDSDEYVRERLLTIISAGLPGVSKNEIQDALKMSD